MTSPIIAFIEETERLIEEATKAPWKPEVWYGNEDGGFAAIGPHHNVARYKNFEDDPGDLNGLAAKDDAQFIAEARTRLPQAITALKVAVDALEYVRSEANIYNVQETNRCIAALTEIERILGVKKEGGQV
jgi:hypothetical protein